MKRIIFFCLIVLCLQKTIFGYYEDFSDIENDDGEYVETVASVGVPTLNARAAFLYDATYDRILFEKNAKQRRANASTTKMITALVAYERGNLEDIVEVSSNAANVGGSNIQLKTGDKITLNDLLNGLLIHSGNDAAVAIAEYIAGDIATFSELMNAKAEEIGAVDTHFVTPHGLDEENHYSTAYDLGMIAKELLKNEYLSQIINKTEAEITISGNTRKIATTNEMLSTYDGANGVKTGYTGNAGRCIVTSAQRDGRQLISVVLGCDSKKNRTIDSIRLMNYGFHEYQLVNLGGLVKNDFYISVGKSKGRIYKISKEFNIMYPILESEKEKITVEYESRKNLIAPIYRGESIGTAIIKLDGTKIHTIEYILPENIEKKTWGDYFQELFRKSLELSSIIIK